MCIGLDLRKRPNGIQVEVSKGSNGLLGRSFKSGRCSIKPIFERQCDLLK
jgi:hypothetical protein